jgi:hypothetical protein
MTRVIEVDAQDSAVPAAADGIQTASKFVSHVFFGE